MNDFDTSDFSEQHGVGGGTNSIGGGTLNNMLLNIYGNKNSSGGQGIIGGLNSANLR